MKSGKKEALLPKGVFITGTDTGVGKTVVSALILKELRRRGIIAGAMKPIETGCKKANPKSQTLNPKFKKGELIPTDGIALREAAGMDDSLDLVVPVRFEHPLAPLAASQLEKRPVSIKKIMNAYKKLSDRYDFLVVEGAGGLLVPIKCRDASRYFMSDLVKEMGLPVVVVARPSLGTINHTLLTIEYALHSGLEVLGVVINYSLPSEGSLAEKTNPEILRELCPVPLIEIIPYMERTSQKRDESAISSAGNKIANYILKRIASKSRSSE